MRLDPADFPGPPEPPEIRGVAGFVTRSPEGPPVFMAHQSAMDDMSVPLKKYLHSLPSDLRDALLDASDQDHDDIGRRLAEIDERDALVEERISEIDRQLQDERALSAAELTKQGRLSPQTATAWVRDGKLPDHEIRTDFAGPDQWD